MIPASRQSAILIPLLPFPLGYYFVAHMSRYRNPIDVLIYLLVGEGIIGLLQGLSQILERFTVITF